LIQVGEKNRLQAKRRKKKHIQCSEKERPKEKNEPKQKKNSDKQKHRGSWPSDDEEKHVQEVKKGMRLLGRAEVSKAVY